MIYPNTHKFAPGDYVMIGDDIKARIEEVILGRQQREAIYLVEWWHEGGVRERREFESDLVACEGAG